MDIKRLLSGVAFALSLFPAFAAPEATAPPFIEDFSDRAGALDRFTVIDANMDGNTWLVDSELHARVEFNSAKAMDDWLITPPLQLEAGKKYPLSFTTACALPSYPERLEVCLGTEPSVEGMTVTVVEQFDVADKAFRTVTADITVNATGIYYIGFHGCSDRDCATLFLDDIVLAAGVSVSSPGAPTELTAVADNSGALKATVSFVTPEVDLCGAQLKALDYVSIQRDGVEIKRFDAPAIGTRMVYVDDNVTEGEHTYTVSGYNNDGTGLPADVSTFVGVNIPGAPTAITIFEGIDPGMVTLRWNAPEVDCQGYPLNTDELTYNVYNPYGLPIMEGITERTITFRAIAENSGQLQALYYVTAQSKAGALPYYKGVRTGSIIVGTPTAMPFRESFSGMMASAVWHLVIPQGTGGQWQLTGIDPGPQDGDGGYAEFAPTLPGDSFTLLSEKISVTGENPWLSFYYYSLPTDDELSVSVIPICDCAPVECVFPIAEGNGWSQANIDLRGMTGKTVQILFSYQTKGDRAAHILLDNINVEEGVLHDLTAVSVSVPGKMTVGEATTIGVSLRNAGMEPAEGYSVVLYRDGERVEAVAGPRLEAFARGTVEFTQTPTVFFGDFTNYHAEIEFDADQNMADNRTASVQTLVSKLSYPAVADLAGEESAAGVVLTWSAIDLGTAEPEPVTEDFEDYDPFTISDLGNWTLVDRDGRGTYGIGIDNMPHGGDPFAYILIDNSNFADDPNFVSRDGGHRYLASVCCAGDNNDDWLISPALCGDAQEVSLWARRRGSSASYAHESFEILYSTGSLYPEDFKLVEAFDGIPYEWTQYSASLPEGARYFAVRCTSPDQFALFIDDITYIPADLYADLEVEGYNVYRDGVRLNAEPLRECVFTDTDAPSGKECTYHVTVVYDKGESRLSNGVLLNLSGVDKLFSQSVVSISGSDGCIKVTGALGENISIYSADGRSVAAVRATAGEASVPVSPGIYLVRAGSVTVKVAVR